MEHSEVQLSAKDKKPVRTSESVHGFAPGSVEIWIAIAGYEYCETSTYGRVRKVGGVFRTLTKTRTGYLVIPLSRDGKMKSFYVQRVVAAAFISNPENKPFVNHINGDRCDNNVWNLEWCTQAENAQRMVFPPKSHEGAYVKIDQFTPSGEFIRTWPSFTVASTTTGFEITKMKIQCKNARINPEGGPWLWRYHEKRIEGELWKPFQTDGVLLYISDRGRIRLHTGKVRWGSEGQGYRSISINGNHGRYALAVHRLVCMAFHGPSPDDAHTNWSADHINRVRDDNRAENLRWATKSQQGCNRATFKVASVRLRATVVSLDANTSKIGGKTVAEGDIFDFPSIKTAAQAIEVDLAKFRNKCSKQSSVINGIQWERINSE